MYCPNCGKQNEDGASFCSYCGKALPRSEGQAQPEPAPPSPPVTVPNYLAPAIIVTIFCCWPFGIPAIVYAAQANAKAARGDYPGARTAASNALIWCWVSFGAGLLIIIPYTLLVVVGGLASL